MCMQCCAEGVLRSPIRSLRMVYIRPSVSGSFYAESGKQAGIARASSIRSTLIFLMSRGAERCTTLAVPNGVSRLGNRHRRRATIRFTPCQNGAFLTFRAGIIRPFHHFSHRGERNLRIVEVLTIGDYRRVSLIPA